MHRFLGGGHRYRSYITVVTDVTDIRLVPGRAAAAAAAGRQVDGRIKRGGQTCNFYVYYEVDDDEVPSALSLDDYDAEGEGGWVLLEPVAGEAGEE